jgi:hypothetical protein
LATFFLATFFLVTFFLATFFLAAGLGATFFLNLLAFSGASSISFRHCSRPRSSGAVPLGILAFLLPSVI